VQEIGSLIRTLKGLYYRCPDDDVGDEFGGRAVSPNLPPVPDGVYRGRHPNGALAWEYELAGGVNVGEFRQWHDNGVLAKAVPYVSGKKHGVVRIWNRDGKVLGEYTMSEGKGIERVWNEDGTLQQEVEFISVNASRGKVYDDLGKGWEVFLWNGKPVSKKKFMERLSRANDA
jgi:antitoxin component YwqK of YwqJK toxin-antitoxin module